MGAGVTEGASGHEPVMLDEVIRFLAPSEGGRCLDLTVGAGGHARAVLQRIGSDGVFVGVDRDETVLEATSARLKEDFPQARFIRANFAEIDELRRYLGPIQFNGLLLDLGVSSIQLDEHERGFSFLRSGPLDMRMDRTEGLTAAELLRDVSADELERIIREYGEERYARRIARAIVAERARTRIVDTVQLAALIERVAPGGGGHNRIHPATRTFQALRIAVNRELENLEKFLSRFGTLLTPQGVIVVIAFHSLEDRLVKQRFRALAKSGTLDLLTRKPVRPGYEETRRNRRARSARLRAARLVREWGDEDDGTTPGHPGGTGWGAGHLPDL